MFQLLVLNNWDEDHELSSTLSKSRQSLSLQTKLHRHIQANQIMLSYLLCDLVASTLFEGEGSAITA